MTESPIDSQAKTYRSYTAQGAVHAYELDCHTERLYDYLRYLQQQGRAHLQQVCQGSDQVDIHCGDDFMALASDQC